MTDVNLRSKVVYKREKKKEQKADRKTLKSHSNTLVIGTRKLNVAFICNSISC